MRHSWAVILGTAKGAGLEWNAANPAGSITPSQLRGLLDEVALIEDARPGGTGPLGALRTLLLVSRAHLSAVPAAGAAGIGMAFALGRIRRMDRDGVVGFFPSIDHLADVEKFHEAVSLAYQVASQNRTRLVLAGPAPAVSGHQAFVVNQFARYPRAVMADARSLRPSPWNVSVTIGTVDAFRAAFLATQPALAVMVDAIASVRPGGDEPQAVEAAFARLPKVVFSPGAFARAPQRCLVVPLLADRPDPQSR